MLLQAGVAVAVFVSLVLVHELGHFYAAKMAGIRVERFALGFGPLLWCRKWGETEYSLRLLPLGGYVAMAGEDADSTAGLDPCEAARTFSGAPPWRRFLIAAAGPAANLAAAWLVLVFLAWYGSMAQLSRVVAVAPGSPAASAGLRPGDRIVALNGKPARYVEEFAREMALCKGGVVSCLVRRGEGELAVAIAPRQEQVRALDGALRPAWRFGITVGGETELRRASLAEAPWVGTLRTVELTGKTCSGIAALFSGNVPLAALGGPLMIAQVSAQQARVGLPQLLLLLALLHINLGLMNLLPIPVLDGGHLAGNLYRMVARRPVPARLAGWGQRLGLALLMLVMLVASYNDLRRVIVPQMKAGTPSAAAKKGGAPR